MFLKHKQKYLLALLTLFSASCYGQNKLYRYYTYHSNGKKQSEYYSRYAEDPKYLGDSDLYGHQDSLYTLWDKSGKKILQGLLRKGMESGKWTSWDRENPDYNYKETFYTNGVEDSTYEFVAWPGWCHRKRDEEFYSAKTERSISRSWYKNGKLWMEDQHGSPIDTSRTWDEQGRLTDETVYNRDTSVWKSRTRFRGWYRNGKLEYERFFLDNKDDSVLRYWNKKGILTDERQYKNGKKEGFDRTWEEDGKPSHEAFYANGILLWRKEYEDGKLVKETEYDAEGKVMPEKE